MSNADALLLFIVIVVSYLMLSAIILLAAHHLDRQRGQDQKDRATMQRQLSVIYHSIAYLESMARVARGDVEAMEEEDDADLFVAR